MKAFTAFFLAMVALPALAANYTKVALVSVSSAYDEQTVPYVVTALEGKGYTVTNRTLSRPCLIWGMSTWRRSGQKI